MRSRSKFVIFLLVCCLVIAISVFLRWGDGRVGARLAEAPTTLTTQCVADGELANNIMTLKLQFGGPETATVRRAFLEKAGKSSECRSQLIQALMSAMEQAGKGPNTVLGGVNSETYFLWSNGADLLAELQATEALDLLITNFGVTDGLSTSMSHFPAVNGVIRIGEPAIPKLQVALNENSQPYMRKFAAFCIASIGGAESRDVLASAVPKEADPCVSNFISISIEALSDKAQPNQISARESGRWYSALHCRAKD
jgi:hypothetical protein